MDETSDNVRKNTFFQNLIARIKSVSDAPKSKKSYFPSVPSASLKRQWAKWSRFHHELEQRKRKVRVLDKKYICLSINRNNGTGKFYGANGERYTTTLKKCNCVDFQRRSKPCKHMYHLASQLELINLAESESPIVQLQQTLKLLPDSTLIVLAKMLKTHRAKDIKYFALAVNEVSAPLLYRGYCIDNKLTTSILEVLPVATIKEMLQATKLEYLPPMNSQRITFLKWFNEDKSGIANEVDKYYFIFEFCSNVEESSEILYNSIIEIQKTEKNKHRR